MGIMQAAYRTYEAFADQAGIAEEGKEALCPLSHMVMKANFEITIDTDGRFQRAIPVPDEDSKTIIPATISSASRSGKTPPPHPLSDKLIYLSQYGGDKFDDYLVQLEDWANSEFSHPKVKAVLKYVQGQTILNDLAQAELIKSGEKESFSNHVKDLIRWRVIPSPDGVPTACWQDLTLFNSFIEYHMHKCVDVDRDLCMVTGEEDMYCGNHPTGTVSICHKAKLLSGTDKAFKGRFRSQREAYSVGYIASQKAHSALRWLVANNGVIIGKRTFICWNPEGKDVPTVDLLKFETKEKPSPSDYKRQLLTTLGGYRNKLADTDDVMIASFEAATKGRLSLTYYNELKASDFLARLEHWYSTCCVDSPNFGVYSPSLKRIVNCASGVERENKIKAEQIKLVEANEAVLRYNVQRLLHCVISKERIPRDIVVSLANKASNPLAYSKQNREIVISTAAAVIRKYKNDRANEEVFELALDLNNTDRSYLFGRLLAIFEQVEQNAQKQGEERETNSDRFWNAFSQRPMDTFDILLGRMKPYFSRLKISLQKYYMNMIDEIGVTLSDGDSSKLNNKLDSTYIIGYLCQRNALRTKKEKNEESDEEEV